MTRAEGRARSATSCSTRTSGGSSPRRTPQRDRDVVVALAPGSYRVKRVLADRLEVATVALAAGDRADVDQLAYDVGAALGRHRQGRPARPVAAGARTSGRARQAFGLLAEGQAAARARDVRRAAPREPGRSRSRGAAAGARWCGSPRRTSASATSRASAARSTTRSRPIRRSARIRCSRSGTSRSASSTPRRPDAFDDAKAARRTRHPAQPAHDQALRPRLRSCSRAAACFAVSGDARC